MKKEAGIDFKSLLRDAALKATPGRLAILDVLKREKHPAAISDIYKKIGKKLNNVTVYRAVEDLVKAGIVRQINFGHSHAYYELIPDRSHHHHIVCKGCGDIEDVEVCGTEKIEKKILGGSKKFKIISSHSLEFFGVCKSCA